MGKNQSTFTAKLRIKAIIDEAQQELNTFGDSLKKAWSNGEPPKSMGKAFEQMRARLESIREISKKGLVNTSDLQRAEQDYQSFQKDIHNLLVEFKLMSTEQKRAMLGKEEQENINARASAIKEYTTALEKNNKAIEKKKALEAQRKDIESKQVGRVQAQATIDEGVPKLKKLKDAGGPLGLSKEAQEYKNTLKEQAELLAKVEQAQARVNSLERKGLKKDGNNQLTEAKKELELLQRQQEKFNNLAGKAEYEEALNKYNQEVASLEDSIASANESLKKMDEEFAEIDNQLKKLSIKDMNSEFDALKKRLQSLGVEGIEGAKDIDELRKAVQDLDNKAIAGVDEEIKKMVSELTQMGSTAQQAKQGIDSATESIEQQKEALREQEAFESKIKQFLGLAGAAQVMRSALHNAMSTVKELDATMTEMAVVTDLSVGDYWDQLPQYSERANELGVSINAAYEAATLYYQQGLKANEVSAISAETLKLAKIAGLDAANATNKMTAALRGFNMELNETSAQRVSDVYSQLAAITAADVKEISNAMTKTASIASSAGMEFETTAAFLSQIIETTRESAETAGTALKTVIARFQELKKDPSEIGEVEGEIVDANAIETALRSVGVALRDSSGQFRELDDVFLELSSKWSGLDKNTQRYIATIAAGSRQQSRFIAMMQDYARTQELVTAANNSAGASQKQFEKTTESLQAKLTRLKNAWDEFTMGIMDSDLIKKGIDVLTKFLEIVNKATSGLNGLGGSITKIASIMVVFKVGQAIFEKLKAPLQNFFAEIVRKAGETGEQAGNAAKQGLRRSQDNQQEGTQNIGTAGKLKNGIGALKKKGSLIRSNAIRNRANKADEKYNNLPIGASDKQREKAFNKLEKEYEKFAKSIQYTDEEIDEINKNAEQGWRDISSAISNAGVSLSIFGGFLSSLGAEEAGQSVAKFGNIILMTGTAMSTVLPLLNLLGIKFDQTSNKIVIGAIKAKLALWELLLIVGAIIAIVAVFVTIAKNIQKNSPEGKLKAAQESTERASEAAERAKESYEGLASAIDQLDDKYKALDELTRGTKEWNKAVLEANASVMDLIDKYPELATLVKNKGGVLTLDLDSDAVQNVMNKAYEASISAANVQQLANIAEAVAESAVDRKRLDKSINFTYDHYATIQNSGRLGSGPATVLTESSGTLSEENAQQYQTYSLQLSNEQIDIFAKRMAEGAFVDKESDSYKDALKELGLSEDLESSAKQFEILNKSIEGSEEAIREYGESLLLQKEQERAMYDAMAASVVGLTNTMNMSDDRIQQMYNIADGESYAEAYNKVYDKIKGENVNFIDETSDGAEDSVTGLAHGALKDLMTEQEIDNAFENAGYKDYDLDQKKGKISYVGADGKRVKSDITEKDIERILATEYAKNITKKKSDNAGLLMDSLLENAGDDAAALSKALKSESGEFLSSDDAKKLTKDRFSEIYKNIDNTLKSIYSEEELWEELEKSRSSSNLLNSAADNIFKGLFGEDGKDFSNLVAGSRKGFAEKLEEMSYKQANEGTNFQSVATELSELFNLDQVGDNTDAIAARINATDWSSIEQLNALQHDLAVEYGLSTDTTKDLINSIKKANYAVSAYALSINEVAHVKIQQELAESTDKLTKLQYKYNQALKDGRTNVSGVIQDIINERKTRGQKYQTDFNTARENMTKLYAQGLGALGVQNFGVDLSSLDVKLNQDGTLNYDAGTILTALQSGTLKQDAWDTFLKEMEKQRKIAIESEQGIQEEIEAIQDLEDELKDSYDDLRERAVEAYTEKLQKQIDIQQEQLDATKEASNKLVNKIQEQIDDQRQAREREQTEKEIADNQAKLAYLGMDTSGGNMLERLELEKQIAEQEQDYTDSLIDQSIQSLQDANEKAFEQRERQITLQEEQLSAYTSSVDFQNKIDSLLNTALSSEGNFLESDIGEIIEKIETVGMTETQKKEWSTSIKSIAELAASYKTEADDRNDAIVALNGWLQTLNVTLNKQPDEEGGMSDSAYDASYNSAADQLKSAGFNQEYVQGLVTSAKNGDVSASAKMSRMLSIAKTDTENQEKADNLYQTLQKAGVTDVQTKTAYYEENKEAIANGSLTTSYTDYLDQRSQNEKAKLVTNSPKALTSTEYEETLDKYKELGGDEVAFKEAMAGKYVYEKVEGVTVPQENFFGDFLGDGNSIFSLTDIADGKEDRGLVQMGEEFFQLLAMGDKKIEGMPGENEELSIYLASPDPYSEKQAYLNIGGTWYQLGATGHLFRSDDFESFKKKVGFKTGGLADFTGPAWLDGTPSKPEYILNADQTERFFSLIDVLENYNKDNGPTKPSGDNYFDININVEKIEDDYSVEQIADKIRRMIYDDATYRNVNSINHIR